MECVGLLGLRACVLFGLLVLASFEELCVVSFSGFLS